MSFFLRLFAFAGTAAAGVTLGYYGLALRPSPQINVTAADRIALPPSHPMPPRPMAPIIVPEPPAPRQPWTLRQEAATVTDLTNVYLSVPSEEALTCGPRRRASLILRCLEDQTSVYIAHDCATPPTDPDGWPVDLRLGDGPATRMLMQVDSQGEALGHWEHQAARILIERLLTADTLHLGFADADGIANRMHFPLSGLGSRLDTLKTACHWAAVPSWEIGPRPLPVEGAVNTHDHDQQSPFRPPNAPPPESAGHFLSGSPQAADRARNNPPTR
ncbi:Type VI secretion system VasI, EvfG, VC_A0118 [Jannaschia faecimaris]|uniref:Type VI secretion system VasI, EvfG, VC_A0118 n=1 Tax=Jannaschia faecimaris TaxID=1244108 RepID=A0A1H3L7J8_9RHOB|nr:type VI secretion system-associated protein TagO [Jannaschia faecimaris]SDY60179.1 Type VI secretion system VasI, EvfG, VC_A0118 [Jannaschia faecimaris]